MCAARSQTACRDMTCVHAETNADASARRSSNDLFQQHRVASQSIERRQNTVLTHVSCSEVRCNRHYEGR